MGFDRSKFRKGRDLARRKAKKSPYETIQIICEGETEANYFRNLRNHFRLNTANIIVLKGEGSAPISLVDHGIELAKNTPDIDHIACVFDRDNHESYKRAIDKLGNHKSSRNYKSKPKYKAVTSTPCFEIWLLLHFDYSTKPFYASGNKSAADNLISELQRKIPSYNKGMTYCFESLINKLTNAIENSKKLQKHNEETNSANPDTNIHELVEYLMNLKQN